MYNCGPTVYDRAHIGNLRAYVFADTLRRTFEYAGFSVKQVVNITDVGHLTSDADAGEDKMSKALARENLPMTLSAMHDVGTKYMLAFIEDLKELQIELPTEMPRASDNIAEDIELIKKLEKKDFIYTTSDGVYFDTSKFKGYGKLGGLFTDKPKVETKSRIAVNTEKKNPVDFALWKFSHANTEEVLGWDSPWGKGFPGWHIECSAMSQKYLGQPFDIHTGGIDHISVHHNNEIAQSEAAYDTTLANYWMHNEFITLRNAKMAKSDGPSTGSGQGGFLTLESLQQEGVSPLAYRYWLLTAHYRSPANFTFEAVKAAQNALIRLLATVSSYSNQTLPGTIIPAYKARFETHIADDLNIPQALALVWELAKDDTQKPEDKRATIIDFDRVLGLNVAVVDHLHDEHNHDHGDHEETPFEIIALAEAREEARQSKEWEKADALRKEIEKRGFSIVDEDKGYEVRKK